MDKSLEALKQVRDTLKGYMDDAKYTLDNGYDQVEIEHQYTGYMMARTEYRAYRYCYLAAKQKVEDLEHSWPVTLPRD
jgi:hypothetical protein